ncbi:MAG TPA: 5'-nucleotidase, lipoprotein e(P4) family [Kiloniellales bacterium]
MIAIKYGTYLRSAAGGLALLALSVSAAQAADQNDNLNATLWMQSSVEYQGATIGAYRLAAMMLDKALADKSWTAVPGQQTGAFQDLPPAVILDLDETVLDNSDYQAWMVANNETFSEKTWGEYVNTVTSRAIPGALEFTKYADSKGVKVFYVSNRTGDLEEATRKNMEMFGFPMGGNVDTVLLKKEKDEWKSSAKSPRWAHVAKDYRVLLQIGDNLGDFMDEYKGSIAERQASMEAQKAMWGERWIVLPNPTYGSWESAAFGHNYKLSGDEQRDMKLGVLSSWKP